MIAFTSVTLGWQCHREALREQGDKYLTEASREKPKGYMGDSDPSEIGRGHKHSEVQGLCVGESLLALPPNP